MAAESGYGGIGLWMTEIEDHLQAGHSLEELAGLLGALDLEVVEICFVDGWQESLGDALESTLSRAKTVFETSRGLACSLVVAVPTPGRIEGDPERGIENFRRLCETAQVYEVNVALEFPCSATEMNSLEVAWPFVRRAGCENGGLLIDTFHFFVGGSLPRTILEVPADKIFLVHVSDAENVPAEKLRQKHSFRTFPGEGMINYQLLLENLRKVGYDGVFSLEIFNGGFLAKDARELARRGIEALSRLLRDCAWTV